MPKGTQAVVYCALILVACCATPTHAAARLDPRKMPPSTRPSAGKFKLPTAFGVLSQRSLFARNGMAVSAPDAAPQKPEAAMALRGIAMGDTSFVAFIEDTISHRTLTLHSGDGVAGGRIRSLDLDELAYEGTSGVMHIRVGQNLLGGIVPPFAPPPPPAAPAAAPTDQAPPPNAIPPGQPMPVRVEGTVAMAAPTPG